MTQSPAELSFRGSFASTPPEALESDVTAFFHPIHGQCFTFALAEEFFDGELDEKDLEKGFDRLRMSLEMSEFQGK